MRDSCKSLVVLFIHHRHHTVCALVALLCTGNCGGCTVTLPSTAVCASTIAPEIYIPDIADSRMRSRPLLPHTQSQHSAQVHVYTWANICAAVAASALPISSLVFCRHQYVRWPFNVACARILSAYLRIPVYQRDGQPSSQTCIHQSSRTAVCHRSCSRAPL